MYCCFFCFPSLLGELEWLGRHRGYSASLFLVPFMYFFFELQDRVHYKSVALDGVNLDFFPSLHFYAMCVLLFGGFARG